MKFLRWFLSICPTDPQVVPRRAFWVMTVFVLFIFFGARGTPATIVMGFLVVCATMAFLDGLGRTLLHNLPENSTVPWRPVLHVGLAACLGWQLLGWLVMRPADVASMQVLGSTLAIIAVVILAQSAMSDRSGVVLPRLIAMIFWVGALSALLSLALHVHDLWTQGSLTLPRLLTARLLPIGRATHEIGSAAGFAVSLLAGLLLWQSMGARLRMLASGAIVILIASIALTQSRGVMLAMVVAFFGMWLIPRLRAPGSRALGAVALAALGFALPMLLILFEDVLKQAICTDRAVLCRDSLRLDIWARSVVLVLGDPLFGLGPSARLDGPHTFHPHNAMIGSVVFFGIPILLPILVLLGGAVSAAARSVQQLGGRFALSCLFFAVVSLATDRSNIFGDLNTHFLYLWLPVGLAFSLEGARSAKPPEA